VTEPMIAAVLPAPAILAETRPEANASDAARAGELMPESG